MCRLAAAVGPPESTAADLLYVPEHSLSEQAWRPREQQHGHVNVDGTGVAWWPAGSTTPLSYVTVSTPWADPNLPSLAASLTGSPILAAVRGATPGVGHGISRVAPFVHEQFAFAHNGWLSNWRTDVGRELVGQVGARGWAVQPGISDSRLLFGLLLDQLAVGLDLAEAVTRVVGQVAKHVAATGNTATMNILAANRNAVVATRAAVGFTGNSLHVHRAETGLLRVASEPLDAASWQRVPDASLVHLADGRIELMPLDVPELSRD
ncbi:MAG: class II glutamine amidotransferase [Nitriliruptorales bacterium]|nr:class II glutamine amidotransferase [Nitriliruptorales bacterium]